MKLKNHEIEWLAHKIQEHVEGVILSTADLEFYFPHLPPETTFSGKAYRVIFHKDHTNLNHSVKNNRCFAKNIEALKEFISYQKFQNKDLPYKIYHGEIKGIDVNSLILYLNNLGHNIPTKYFFEEEVIALEITSFSEISS